jgi:uncharacterized protein (DUF1697 family)
MGVQIALFRGINVGRAKRIAMADLRKLFASLGYSGIVTVLNSGNVVFEAGQGDAEGHGLRIRAAVLGELGVDAPVLVVPAGDFSAIWSGNPLGALVTDPSRMLVAFPAEAATLAELARLATSDWTPDVLRTGPGAGYLWCPTGSLAGPLFPALNRRLGERVTTRNGATMGKIQALL